MKRKVPSKKTPRKVVPHLRRKVIVAVECELEGDSEEMLDALMLTVAKNRHYQPHIELGGGGTLCGSTLTGIYGIKSLRVIEVKLP